MYEPNTDTTSRKTMGFIIALCILIPLAFCAWLVKAGLDQQYSNSPAIAPIFTPNATPTPTINPTQAPSPTPAQVGHPTPLSGSPKLEINRAPLPSPHVETAEAVRPPAPVAAAVPSPSPAPCQDPSNYGELGEAAPVSKCQSNHYQWDPVHQCFNETNFAGIFHEVKRNDSLSYDPDWLSPMPTGDGCTFYFHPNQGHGNQVPDKRDMAEQGSDTVPHMLPGEYQGNFDTPKP